MKTETEIEVALTRALREVVDARLLRARFTRREGATRYVRSLGESIQTISFVTDAFPKASPGADAHVHPMVRLEMPRMSEEALRLTGRNNMLLANAPHVIVNEPIDFAIPTAEHRRWFVKGEEAFLVACREICELIERYVLPLIGELTTVPEFIRMYERDDPRILKQRHFYIFVAAAYEVLGARESAQEVVQFHLGSAGLKRRYAAVFEALGIA